MARRRKAQARHAVVRTLKAKGELDPKYPGHRETQARRLRAEGHTIVERGKRWFVAGVA